MLAIKMLFHSSWLHSTVTQPEHCKALSWLMEEGAAEKKTCRKCATCGRTALESRAVRGEILHLSANNLQSHYLWAMDCIVANVQARLSYPLFVPYIQNLTLLCCRTVDQVLQQQQRIKTVLYWGHSEDKQCCVVRGNSSQLWYHLGEKQWSAINV